MKKLFYFSFLSAILFLSGCSGSNSKTADTEHVPATEVKHPEWSRQAVIYEVNIRQYTQEGTFEAFRPHLPRLRELGVDVLWFMPVYPISEVNRKGTLGSYYAIRDYKGVNPEFGTANEFRSLVKEAQKMGFKVLLDWVANHSGGDNIWLEEHPDWYVRDENGDPMIPYDWSDTYKLDYTNPDMRAGMIDALTYWVSEYNIDGYRCDVAYEVPTDFWEDARQKLDAIKPVFMLAEAETADLLEKAFDMNYNWRLKDLMNQIVQGEKAAHGTTYQNETTEMAKKQAIDIDVMLAHQNSIYPSDSYRMNFITNHDENSWDGSEFKRLGQGVEAFAVLTYTLPGMPLIYTGQETGMDRELEFFEKDTPPDWTINPWFDFYKKLNELKHTQEALAAGTKGGDMVRYPTESDDLYIFSRTQGNSTVLVYLNLNGTPSAITYKENAPAGSYQNFFTATQEELPSQLDAWEYRVYVK
ncbi:MAG: alpha-amylase [Bacteroides sp.]|nr:alpha-amylase [Bacteroides sp.]